MEFNFALVIFLVWFLPFIVSLLGRNPRLKGLTLALCLATMLSSPSSDVLSGLCWLGAWVSATLAILAWFSPKADCTAARSRGGLGLRITIDTDYVSLFRPHELIS